MNKANFMVKDQRSESVERKELRKLILCGDLMSQMINANIKTKTIQDLAENWQHQLERARTAGSFK
jgi:hypothetical protein